MTKEQVIAMAREAGFAYSWSEAAGEALERFATLARNAALEEAADLCDEYANDKWSLYKGRSPYDGTEAGRADPDTQGHSDGAANCGDAIRAMKEPTT